MQLICKFQNGQKKKKPKKRIQLDNKYALPDMAKTTESAQLSGSAKSPNTRVGIRTLWHARRDSNPRPSA